MKRQKQSLVSDRVSGKVHMYLDLGRGLEKILHTFSGTFGRPSGHIRLKSIRLNLLLLEW